MTSSKLAPILASLVLGTAVVLAGCNDDNDSTSDGTKDGGVATDANSGQVDTITSDGQIFTVLAAVNAAEQEQGEIAQNRGVAEGVKLYATGMVEMHEAAQEAQNDLKNRLGLTSESSALATDLTGEQTGLTADLKAVEAASFDVKYMDVQVANHEKVLEVIDKDLLRAARNADVSQAVKDTRKMVEDHLQWAKSVRGDLKGADGGTI